MENKDLSRDFAIVFGIKPEEVPSNSSGNKSDFNALATQALSNLLGLNSKQSNALLLAMREKIEDGGFKNNVKESNTTEGIKMSKTNKQFLKEQVDELKIRSEMESSKTDQAIDAMKGLARQSGLLPLESDKYSRIGLTGENKIEHRPFPKGPNVQTGEKETTEDKYVVTFKDGLTTIITKSMFDSLCDYAGKSNVNGYNIVSSLLFASDSETGEMICLDSSSILSIVKCK